MKTMTKYREGARGKPKTGICGGVERVVERWSGGRVAEWINRVDYSMMKMTKSKMKIVQEEEEKEEVRNEKRNRKGIYSTREPPRDI